MNFLNMTFGIIDWDLFSQWIGYSVLYLACNNWIPLVEIEQWPLLLTWFNFNPSMDK